MVLRHNLKDAPPLPHFIFLFFKYNATYTTHIKHTNDIATPHHSILSLVITKMNRFLQGLSIKNIDKDWHKGVISFLRCYSDEQHVGGSEDHVRGVTDPDVPDRVHDIHRKSDDNGENAEREFAPHCPRHLNQSYTESSKGTCSKINK